MLKADALLETMVPRRIAPCTNAMILGVIMRLQEAVVTVVSTNVQKVVVSASVPIHLHTVCLIVVRMQGATMSQTA